ncbi:hypothetical protein KC333_g213 [Hortaea werneckii]|nr:hypothetical protein KC333_g213 [Hortaea werneckii]
MSLGSACRAGGTMGREIRLGGRIARATRILAISLDIAVSSRRAYLISEFTLSSTTDEESHASPLIGSTYGSQCRIVYGSPVRTTKHLHELFGGAWNELVLAEATSQRWVMTLIEWVAGQALATMTISHFDRLTLFFLPVSLYRLNPGSWMHCAFLRAYA